MVKVVCYQCWKAKNKESSYFIDEKYFCEECFEKIITGQEKVKDIKPEPDT